jgi:hypothetical protein
MTSATRQTKKSGKSVVRFGSPGGVDDLDEAATLARQMDGTLNDRDLEAGDSFMQVAADEDDANDGPKDEEKKKDSSPLKEFFRDPVDGQLFDP